MDGGTVSVTDLVRALNESDGEVVANRMTKPIADPIENLDDLDRLVWRRWLENKDGKRPSLVR